MMNIKHTCHGFIAQATVTNVTLRDNRDCVRGSRKQNRLFYSISQFVRSRMRVSTFVTVVA
jgi:hypothetical protein